MLLTSYKENSTSYQVEIPAGIQLICFSAENQLVVIFTAVNQ